MICLLYSIRDKAKKEKSPRSVGASGGKFFCLQWFWTKNTRKKIPLLNSLKKFEKHLHCWFHWKKIKKNFRCWFHWKKSKKISTADFIEKKSKNFSTADFIEKKSKKISTADFLFFRILKSKKIFLKKVKENFLP